MVWGFPLVFRGKEQNGWVVLAEETLDGDVLEGWLTMAMEVIRELPPKWPGPPDRLRRRPVLTGPRRRRRWTCRPPLAGCRRSRPARRGLGRSAADGSPTAQGAGRVRGALDGFAGAEVDAEELFGDGLGIVADRGEDAGVFIEGVDAVGQGPGDAEVAIRRVRCRRR
ncbi:hypothetical protein GCM10010388_68980 [Streptomyces mauvecolor]